MNEAPGSVFCDLQGVSHKLGLGIELEHLVTKDLLVVSKTSIDVTLLCVLDLSYVQGCQKFQDPHWCETICTCQLYFWRSSFHVKNVKKLKRSKRLWTQFDDIYKYTTCKLQVFSEFLFKLPTADELKNCRGISLQSCILHKCFNCWFLRKYLHESSKLGPKNFWKHFLQCFQREWA